MDDSISFGTWLKQQRRICDLTQVALAQQVGCAQVTIQKIELNERRPSKQMLERLIVILRVAPADRDRLFALARTAAYQSPAVLPASVPTSAFTLPVPLTPLVGRTEDVRVATALLERSDVRLITLVGPPGVGKTRLALQVASGQTNFADGVVFVSLAAAQHRDGVAEAIGQALGLPLSNGQDLIVALQTWLRFRQLLLVLDTMEHVRSAALLVHDLLQTAPRLKVMATSRAILHIAGEHIYVVQPLALPDMVDLPGLALLAQVAAVELFVQRAQAVQTGFALTLANAAVVAAICVRLDGLPLALELAAARLRLFAPSTLLAHLAQRLPLLANNTLDAPAHQQTLHTAIAWSYALLSPAEQQLFQRLAVFVGGWNLAGAQAIATRPSDTSAVVEDMNALVNHSLMHVTTHSDTAQRYTMLELIHEYALEQLAASGQQHEVQHQHALFYTTWAEAMQSRCIGATQQLSLTTFEVEYPNLRAALEWSTASGTIFLAARLASALWPFWYGRSATREGQAWLERLIAESAQLPVAVQARLFFAAGMVCQQATALTASLQYFNRSLLLARATGDSWGEAASSLMSGITALMHGDVSGAEVRLTDAAPLVAATGDWWLRALLLLAQGECQLVYGAFTLALPVLEQGLALAQTHHDGYLTARTLICVARAALGAGELLRAHHLCLQGLSLSQWLHISERVADATNVLGRVLLYQGQVQQAADAFRTSLGMYRDLDHWVGITWCIEGLACIAAAHQHWHRATQFWGAASALHIKTGRPLPPVECAEYTPICDQGHQAIGDSAFCDAWEAGAATMPETMIGYALSEQLGDYLV